MSSNLQTRALLFCLCGFFICALLSSQPADALDSGTGSEAEAKAQVAPSPTDERKSTDEIEALRAELKERPTDFAASLLGELLLGKGELNEAMASFDAALKLNPRSFEARVGKGIVLGRQGEFGKAELALREALALNPHPVRVHYELGLLHEKQGEFGKAVAEYKEGLNKYLEGKR